MIKGFPVLLCGTTDAQKRFHPFSLSICSNETEEDFYFIFNAVKKAAKTIYNYEYKPNILIADAAPAIHNGFMAAFSYKSLDEFFRVMCWSHVERNCEDNLKSLEYRDIREEVLNDIKLIQLMPSTAAFNHAISLFFDKWGKND